MAIDVGKRQVFVGSSTEGKSLAESVIAKLDSAGLHTLPWFDFFKHERPPIQELEELTLRAHAAVLIATPDDRAIIRERNWRQMRDNVLFEYGLFSGAIGRSKCGLLVPDEPDFRIPSDFLGVACFAPYTPTNASNSVSAFVTSLASSLSRPQLAETLQSRSRRILCLIGWVRDETLRLIEVWDSERARTIVADRLRAVSAFLEQDIDALDLRTEYDAVEHLVIDAVDTFPTVPDFPYQFPYVFDELLRGSFPANRDVLYALLRAMRQSELAYNCSCDQCRDFWQWRRPWADWPSGHVPYHTCASLWAIGVAEATTVFEYMIRKADLRGPIRQWTQKNLAPLNEAIVGFERRLHKRLFGTLEAEHTVEVGPTLHETFAPTTISVWHLEETADSVPDTNTPSPAKIHTGTVDQIQAASRGICTVCGSRLKLFPKLLGRKQHRRCPTANT